MTIGKVMDKGAYLDLLFQIGQVGLDRHVVNKGAQ